MNLFKRIVLIVLFGYFLTNAMVLSALPQPGELNYKEVIWAKIDDTDRMVSVSEPSFRRGEVIYLILRQVGTFQVGEDGKCRMDIDMTVKDPSGQIILDKTGLLEEKGHIEMKNGIADSPHGFFESNVNMEPGEYRLTLTIRDTISGTKATVVKSFQLRPGLGYEKAIFGRKNAEGKIDLLEDPVFQRGEIVNLVVLNAGTFQKDATGKHRFDIDLVVLDPNDTVALDQKDMLGENGYTVLENDIASSPYAMFYSTIEMEAGTYIMKLTLRDLNAQQEFTVTKSFKLN